MAVSHDWVDKKSSIQTETWRALEEWKITWEEFFFFLFSITSPTKSAKQFQFMKNPENKISSMKKPIYIMTSA